MQTEEHDNKKSQTASSDEMIIKELLPRPFGPYGKLWTIGLAVIAVIGFIFYIQQLRQGLSITGMRDYSTWGIYISNFVFFVAISLVGSLISAILKLSQAKWQTSLTRISEMIAVAAIIFAAIIIIVDMGRPDRFLNVIFHARIQSPIIWDVIVISTYLVISLLLLYIPMLPDLAIMRDHSVELPKWQRKMYTILALNWQNKKGQEKILSESVRILAVLIIPVAFGIHTVTSWLFATTVRPGWDSTNFGPYFVSGAFMVGCGAVIVAMFMFRKFYHLDQYFSDKLFDKMGRLLVLLSFIYLYFNINEYFVPAYKMKASESAHLEALFTGDYALLFWSVQIIGMIIPIVVLLFNKGRKPLSMFFISILVILGAWFKRFLIVAPTLDHPLIPFNRVPESWLHYNPTIQEWFITGGTLAGALLIVTLLVRLFPIIPIAETLEEQKVKGNSKQQNAIESLEIQARS